MLFSILIFLTNCAPSVDGNSFCNEVKSDTPLLSVSVMKLKIIDKLNNQSVFVSTNTGFNKDSFQLFAGNTEITFDSEAFKNDTIKTQQWYTMFNSNSDKLILKYNSKTKDTLKIAYTSARNVCNNVAYESFTLDSIFVKNKKVDIESSTRTYIIKR